MVPGWMEDARESNLVVLLFLYYLLLFLSRKIVDRISDAFIPYIPRRMCFVSRYASRP